MPVHQRGAKMRTLKAAGQLTAEASIPVTTGGSWWLPDASTGSQAMAAPISTAPVRVGSAFAGPAQKTRRVQRLLGTSEAVQ